MHVTLDCVRFHSSDYMHGYTGISRSKHMKYLLKLIQCMTLFSLLKFFMQYDIKGARYSNRV